MIERKIWKGDLLRLAEGNSFYGLDQVVHHRAGYAMVAADSDPGDPLVTIDGGAYIVKRADLFELNEKEVRTARAMATINYAGLNGSTKEETQQALRELEEMETGGVQ